MAEGGDMLAAVGLAVSLLAAALWAAGLVALVIMTRAVPRSLAAGITRFSPLASASAVAVVGGGLAGAAVGLDGPGSLFTTRQGVTTVGAALLLCLLVIVGRMHRRSVLAQTSGLDAEGARDESAVFRRFVTEEIVLLTATAGTALAMAVSGGAIGSVWAHGQAHSSPGSPEELILGYVLPDPPSLAAVFGTLHPDVFGIVFATFSTALYAAGVVTLLRRGDRWPAQRTIVFLLGVATVLLVTCTGLGRYASAVFSLHMVQHMVLNMVSPLLLVAGAPVTLALRALPLSERRVLLAATRSRAARFFSHPVTVTAIFVVSLYLLYFTPLFELAMRNHWGHVAMQVHFLASGFLFFWFVIGVDPDRNRPGPLHRVPILLTAILSHTVFAVVLVFGVTAIGADFYRDLDLTWAPDLLTDQALAGGISWVLGELVTVGVLVALIMRWFAGAERADRAVARMRAVR